jgi:hypothetical protein
LHHRLRNAHPDVAPEKNWQPPFPPSARVQDALAALDDCRALAPPELAEAEFWEVFGRQLQKLELGDTLAEVQFRDSFRRSHDR